tara:strand:+ start:118 stop:324 length:207 start_codon:yes stop_codon:yes gene_type:complete
MIRTTILLLLLVACTSCSELALLASGTSVAISHNAYAKAYGGMDVLTIINTEKDIKTHLYESIQDADK